MEAQELFKKSIINLDKPPGPSSHQVSVWIKSIFGVKAGHAGTLDPDVSGVLPVGLGKATRLLDIINKSGKEYVSVARFSKKPSSERLEDLFEEFTGPIYQTPPEVSAVRKALRIRTIYSLELIEQDEKDILFRASCESGTYIRKLCYDFGRVLGCGCRMIDLRRTRAGPYTEQDSYTLHEVKDAFEFYSSGDDSLLRKILLPVETAVSDLPKAFVKDTAVASVCHGADLSRPGLLSIKGRFRKDETVALMTGKEELIGLGKSLYSNNEMQKLKRGRIIDIQRVIMEKERYPKAW